MRRWRKLGEYGQVHPNDHVNYGQSTNDVFPTAMRLATLLALDTFYPVLDQLAATFAEKAQAFHGIMKSGRTHMQDAVPLRLGQEFAAYGVAMEKGKQFLKMASGTLRELGLGGSAVGTGINTHPDYRVSRCPPGPHFRSAPGAGSGHALGDAIQRLHGRCELGFARDRARNHPHFK